jgi:hypothetical protein
LVGSEGFVGPKFEVQIVEHHGAEQLRARTQRNDAGAMCRLVRFVQAIDERKVAEEIRRQLQLPTLGRDLQFGNHQHAALLTRM